jgi:hypothetical protein
MIPQHNSLIAGCEVVFPRDFVMDLEHFSYYILFTKIISELNV